MVIRQKVEHTRTRTVQSQDDAASQRREEEVGKLQEGRSKATKAMGEGKCRGSEFSAEVLGGTDGTLSSRLNSPIEQFEKSTEVNPQYTAEEDESSRTT